MPTPLDELAAEVPADVLVTDPVLVENYRFDWARDPNAGRPLAVLRPHDTAQVQTVMRWAYRHRIAVVPLQVIVGERIESPNAAPLPEAIIADASSLFAVFLTQSTGTCCVMVSPEGLVEATIVGARPIEPLVRMMLHGDGANGDVPAGQAASAAA